MSNQSYRQMNTLTSLSNLERLKRQSEATHVAVRVCDDFNGMPVFVFEFGWSIGGKRGWNHCWKRMFTALELSQMFMPASALLEVIAESAKIVWRRKVEEMRHGQK